MSSYENEFKFFIRVNKDIELPTSPTKEENVSAKKIDSVTDGVEFVPYWKQVYSGAITIIANDALRLALAYVNTRRHTADAYTYYKMQDVNIPSDYRPSRRLYITCHPYGNLVDIRPDGTAYYISPSANVTRQYVGSGIYTFFSNKEEPPEEE